MASAMVHSPSSSLASSPNSLSFVCNACEVLIDHSSRSAHYGSEWHRYNVKRRVAGMASIPQSLFDTQVSLLKNKKADIDKQKQQQKCNICSKSFATLSAYQAHCQTKKHEKRAQEKAERAERSSAVAAASPHHSLPLPLPSSSSSSSSSLPSSSSSSSYDSSSSSSSASSSSSSSDSLKKQDKEDHENEVEAEGEGEGEGEEVEEEMEGDPVPLGECLFCGKSFEHLDNCIDHMLKHHGFFIPFREFLVDVSGLISYLGVKIGVGNVCIWCNDRYGDMASLRQHMKDKSHCKLSLQDEDDEEEFIDFYNFDKINNKNTDKSKAELIESQEENGESKATGGGGAAYINDFNELVLQDGSTIGHRSLNRYYKQRLRPDNDQRQLLIAQLHQTYQQRYLLTGSIDKNANRTSLAIATPGMREGTKVPVKTKMESKLDRLHLAIGMKNNNQRHYRDQVMF